MTQSPDLKKHSDGPKPLGSVFVNCPYDQEYLPMLKALLFTLIECGLEPRIALESYDCGELRVAKIRKLVRECPYSIHDISRMEPMQAGELPRFNMPFELGLDFGYRQSESGASPRKKCMILEKERHRYKKALSDISGCDIFSHGSDPETLVRRVRDWVRVTAKRQVPSGTRIWQRYNEFYADFEITAREMGYTRRDLDEMPVVELMDFMKSWRVQPA